MSSGSNDSAYANDFLNSGELYSSRAGAACGNFVATHDNNTIFFDFGIM